MNYIGDFAEDATVDIFFTTSDGSGGAVAPSSAFEAADIVIYKGSSATQKTSTNGITMTSPFDATTGLQQVSIDTSNDTGDAGFWQTGNDYTVVLAPDETVDSQTIVRVLAQFSIENRTTFPKADFPANFASMGIEGDGHVHGDLKEWLGSAPAALADTDKVQVSLQHGATDVITATLLATNAVEEIRDAITGGAYALDTDANGRIRLVSGTAAGEISFTSGVITANTTQIEGADATDTINAQCDAALETYGLDHLVSTSVTGTDVADNSIIAYLASSAATADWDTFVNTTDSLQAIRARGDAEWTTGAGGSDPAVLQSTTIATLASQTSFTLTAGSSDDDAYNGLLCVVTDQTTGEQKCVGKIDDYTGSTKTITLHADPGVFTMAVGDSIDILAAAAFPNNFYKQGIDGTSGYTYADIQAWSGVTVTVSATESLPLVSVGEIETDVVDAASLNNDAVLEIRNAITGGAYGLDTDANGRIRIVSGTAAGEISVTSGIVAVNIKQVSDDATAADNLELIIEQTRGVIVDGTKNRLDDLNDVSTADIATEAIRYIGQMGPGVFYNDGAGNTNTTLGVDGTQENPVSSLSAATTLAVALGTLRIYVAGNSTLTLSGQTLADYEIIGVETSESAIVNLGTAASQSTLTRCRIFNCTVYGEHDGSSRLTLDDCLIDDAPAAEVTFLHCIARRCGLQGDITLDTSNDNFFIECFEATGGSDYPQLEATGASGDIHVTNFSGELGLENLTASHTVRLDGVGRVIFESGCNVNAAITLQGVMAVTDNTGGMSNITEDARLDILAINAEADTALSDIHLDHLFATDYDPASKPGTSTALLNELVEDDGGESRFTSNALEQAPSGGGGSDSLLLQTTTIATLASQTSFTLTAGSADDDAYNGLYLIVTDQSTSTQKCVGKISDYTGSSKTITLAEDPGVFTMAVGDTVDILAVPYEVGLVDNAITSGKYDESTAFPLKSDDSGSTEVLRTGADGDTGETLSDQIDSLGGGNGAFSATITVTDGAAALSNVLVRVVNAGDPNETYTRTTDVNGNATFNLDAASWDVIATKGNYDHTTETRTVTGNETGTLVDTDIEMTAIPAVSPPSDPDMCRVTATLYKPDGSLAEGIDVEFQLWKLEENGLKATTPIATRTHTATTNASGELEYGGNSYIDLIRNDAITPSGSYYVLNSPELKLDNKRITLNAATFDLLNAIS